MNEIDSVVHIYGLPLTEIIIEDFKYASEKQKYCDRKMLKKYIKALNISVHYLKDWHKVALDESGNAIEVLKVIDEEMKNIADIIEGGK